MREKWPRSPCYTLRISGCVSIKGYLLHRRERGGGRGCKCKYMQYTRARRHEFWTCTGAIVVARLEPGRTTDQRVYRSRGFRPWTNLRFFLPFYDDQRFHARLFFSFFFFFPPIRTGFWVDVTGDCPTLERFFSNASFLLWSLPLPVSTTFISKFILNLFVRPFVPRTDCWTFRGRMLHGAASTECIKVTVKWNETRLNYILTLEKLYSSGENNIFN